MKPANGDFLVRQFLPPNRNRVSRFPFGEDVAGIFIF
jgi:hypothetical protein